MKSSFSFYTIAILMICLSSTGFAQSSMNISSPDGHIELSLTLDQGSPFYEVHHDNKVFLERSPLGLKTSQGDFYNDLVLVTSETNEIEESYELKNAKVGKVDYRANELVSIFVNEAEDTLHIKFRVSDRDVAFSYRVSTKEAGNKIKILEEVSGFNLPDDATTYISPQAPPMTGWHGTKPSYEEEYTLGEALGAESKNGVGYTFPSLFKLNNSDGWILISETGVDSQYPGSRLSEGNDEGLYSLKFPQEGENNGIGIAYAAQSLPAETPWRTITLGETLKPIVESTVAFDLVEEVYPASMDYKMGRASWSWIVWQDNSMNYEDQVTFIDLAADLDFEYILVDANWDRNIGRDRFVELVDYAKSKDVDVLLWYNSNGFWNNAPQTPKNRMNHTVARQKEMEWLQEIGVKGLKIDFLGGDKQTTMKLYEDIMAEANNYGLMVNFHGSTLPRGWQRMYPNFVTSEAVLASENLVFRQDALDKHAMNATILPFTRNAVGAMDFAPVFLNKRLTRNQDGGTIRSTTDAFELATAVLYFSPVQHFGVTPNNLEEQPEFVLDFLRKVPAVWDETVYIGGTPTDYAAIARRKGEQWYVAVVNGEKTQKSVELSLPMLAGKEVSFLHDKEDSSAGMKKMRINANGVVNVDMLSEGGALIFSE